MAVGLATAAAPGIGAGLAASPTLAATTYSVTTTIPVGGRPSHHVPAAMDGADGRRLLARSEPPAKLDVDDLGGTQLFLSSKYD